MKLYAICLGGREDLRRPMERLARNRRLSAATFESVAASKSTLELNEKVDEAIGFGEVSIRKYD